MLPPRSRLVDLWDRMKSSYWFVPSIMFIGAVLLALGTFRIDLYLERSETMAASPWFPKFSADGSRSILSTLASGMLTVTGVVFSLTVVALQLASTQFGPRLLRTFMNSRGTQIVLGTFTSSFVYYLLVVGTVRGDIGFVQQISTATGILLGVLDIAVLIYFVHHLATSIRIESLLATVNGDLREVIDALFPSGIGEGGDAQPPEQDWDQVARGEQGRDIRASTAGYIRRIDSDMLMTTACEHDLLLRLRLQPGAFVVEGSVLLRVWSDRELTEEVEDRLRASIVLGPDRTTMQDAELAIRQLVEIALRALSPGINDPFTAVECTNRLTDALCIVARRRRPSAQRVDDQGHLRVIAEPVTLQQMVKSAFDPIARAGGGNGDVAARLLEAVVVIASCARHADDRHRLFDFARELEQQMQTQMGLDRDRRAVSQRFQAAIDAVSLRQQPEKGRDAGELSLPLEGETA